MKMPIDFGPVTEEYVDDEIDPYDIAIEYPTKEYTLREIFEALKKNGFEHLRGQWVSTENEKVIGGCVLMQAAVNLNVIPENGFDLPNGDYAETEYSLAHQLNNFKVNPKSKWYTGDGLGTTIIAWNDKVVVDDKGAPVLDDHSLVQYALPTYQDVVEMARELMEPYFDETISLAHYDY